MKDLALRVRTKVAVIGHQGGGHERIAITGMSVVNSLGNDPQTVWTASLSMQSGIRYVPSEKWDHTLFYHPRPGMPEKTYCKVGAFQNLEIHRRDIGVPPQDFRTMTDSTKLTLWLASKAIQESGLLASDIPRERIAVLISQNSGEAAATLQDVIIRASTTKIMEAIHRVAPLSPELQAAVEEEIKAGRLAIDDTTLLGRLNSSAGGFICNRFGFMGPSFSVSAACATGLVALYSAYQMIRNGVIDAAIVGGAEELLTPMHFLEFSALGALAGMSGAERPPREASRPFDFHRDGMVLGEGGGVIVIERESLARKRGAGMSAYITSVGASNNHLGMVESSRVTQKIAIGASLGDLSYGPESIDLVECHATATRHGDIEEVQALKSFFESSGRTVLTSFKSQIGHTLGASGINSLIRGVMAMNAGTLPPTLNFRNPDPQMELAGSNLTILCEPQTWKPTNGGPRRMQVNAFGFGGSNYVVQLEQAMDDFDVVLVSPKHPEVRPDLLKPDLPEGLSFLRTEIGGLSYRLAVEAESEESAIGSVERTEVIGNGGVVTSKWLKALARQGIHLREEKPPPGLAFVFPGQGSHYAGMGYELYRTFPLIREWMDRAASIAEFDLLHLLFHDREEDLQKTRWQQPALFTLEYAMVQYLWSLGIRPDALAGHSLGELTALCLAGVYSFEDGFRIVNKRAVCMDKACSMNLEPGLMMAVDAPLDVLQDLLAGRREVYLTNINSPRQLVAGGNTEEVKLLGAELESNGYRTTILPVSMALHSPIMRCIHDELEAFLAGIEFHAPEIPVVSNTTREPFPDDPEEIKRIIMAHLESPVHWMPNVRTLWNDFGIRLFVEVGPREVLSNLITESIEEAECITTCLPSAEASVLKTALAQLYTRGSLPIRRQARTVSFLRTEKTGSRSGNEVAVSNPGPLPSRSNPIEAIVQKQINSFILESFGRFLKPAILSAIRAEYDPTFQESDLEAVLNQMARISMETTDYDRRQETDEITETVIRIIMKITGYDREEIEPGMDLREDLSIRSSRLPVILDALEGHFGIKIEFEDFRDVRTIRDVSERILRIKAREKSGKHRPERARILQGKEIDSQLRETDQRLPIKRMVFEDIPVESTTMEPVVLSPMDSVVVLSTAKGRSLCTRVGNVIRRDYGCSIVPIAFLAEDQDGESGSFDLRTAWGAHRAAGVLHSLESLAGLAIVLDDTLEAGVQRIEDVSAMLEGFFSLIKTFLQSSDKKFVVLVDLSDEPCGMVRVLAEGLLGLFLSAGHEYAGVLFRAVMAAGEANIRDAVRGALDRSRKYTELKFKGERALSTGGKEVPILFGDEPRLELGHDDVILFTGGCSGIMPSLARSMVPYGCKMAFAGRTPLDADRNPQIINALGILRNAGARAEYFQADVCDPVSVSSLVHSVEEQLGKITGIVHGAAILRDSSMNDMTAKDFSAVVQVKLLGARHLFLQTHESLKFFSCLSSAACIQGNPGQANYACGNRAMSALMSHWSRAHKDILFKAFMLPPIEGAGMAESPDIRTVMKFLNAAYVHVDELSNLFLRELLLGPPEDVWVLFMRSLPDVKTVCLQTDDVASDGGLKSNGIYYETAFFPLIDSVSNVNLRTAELVAERAFNPNTDLWISDHKPFKFMKHPLVSAVMVLELFMEACRILHPTLKVTGVREARFLDMIECPPGVNRHTQVHCRTRTWKAGEVVCEVSLSAKGISPSGRSVERMNPGYEALVLLGTMPRGDGNPDDFPVGMEELNTRSMDREEVIKWYEDRSELKNRYRVMETLDGTSQGSVRGHTVYHEGAAGEDFNMPSVTDYQYSPYLLEALIQVVNFHTIMRDPTEQRSMIPLGIGEVLFGRRCAAGERVTLEARMREQDDEGITWDVRAVDRDGQALMTVRKLRMGWFFRNG